MEAGVVEVEPRVRQVRLARQPQDLRRHREQGQHCRSGDQRRQHPAPQPSRPGPGKHPHRGGGAALDLRRNHAHAQHHADQQRQDRHRQHHGVGVRAVDVVERRQGRIPAGAQRARRDARQARPTYGKHPPSTCRPVSLNQTRSAEPASTTASGQAGQDLEALETKAGAKACAHAAASGRRPAAR